MLCFSLYAYNTSCGSQRKDNQLKDNQEITSFSRIPASNFAFLSLSLVFPILRLLVVYASIDSSFPCIANVGLEGMLIRIGVILLIGLVAWAYQATRPPPPSICGSPGRPPVTAPRIKLRDERHLAYKDHGVSKEAANHNIIFIHGFGSCRHDPVVTTNLPQELVEELGLYIVSFDRPGYGESDPDPKRSAKSLAFDVEELADQSGLGSKFYVIGFSMGGQVVWGCLKYIPHRLAGATLIAPVVNYWWKGFPANLSSDAYYKQQPQDQWSLRVAHYVSWLTFWWNIQKWFPAASVVANKPENIFSRQDFEIISKLAGREMHVHHQAQVKQQGEFESIHRDLMVGFGSWKFTPLDLQNPFPKNEGSVHLWQGDEDKLVPILLQRYIDRKLLWIQYHELPGAGHLFPLAVGMSEAITKALLLG